MPPGRHHNGPPPPFGGPPPPHMQGPGPMFNNREFHVFNCVHCSLVQMAAICHVSSITTP